MFFEKMPGHAYRVALVRLGEDAYGVPISRELQVLARRDVALGSVYAALDRLAEKGLMISRLGEPTVERGEGVPNGTSALLPQDFVRCERRARH